MKNMGDTCGVGRTVHSDLVDALDYIKYDELRGVHKTANFRFIRHTGGQDYEKIEGYLSWFTSVLQGRGFPPDLTFNLGSVFAEMISNAYEHSVLHLPKTSFLAEAYFGDKGVLFGTQQDARFFTEEQIRLVRFGDYDDLEGSVVSVGHALVKVLEEADGVLVLEENKSIHISRLLEEEDES